MRSKGDIDINAIAKEFGGGGHKNASGCSAQGELTALQAVFERKIAARHRAGSALSVMDGVLVVDKPQGLTSHDVVAVARRCLKEPRIGHTGTLDPLATGVLPLACGRATRLVRFLSSSEKDYDAGIQFGLTTDSYDVTGIGSQPLGESADARRGRSRAAVTARRHACRCRPRISAKKVAGQRAYALARRAEPVALEPVAVRVTRAELHAFSGATAHVSLDLLGRLLRPRLRPRARRAGRHGRVPGVVAPNTQRTVRPGRRGVHRRPSAGPQCRSRPRRSAGAAAAGVSRGEADRRRPHPGVARPGCAWRPPLA